MHRIAIKVASARQNVGRNLLTEFDGTEKPFEIFFLSNFTAKQLILNKSKKDTMIDQRHSPSTTVSENYFLLVLVSVVLLGIKHMPSVSSRNLALSSCICLAIDTVPFI